MKKRIAIITFVIMIGLCSCGMDGGTDTVDENEDSTSKIYMNISDTASPIENFEISNLLGMTFGDIEARYGELHEEYYYEGGNMYGSDVVGFFIGFPYTTEEKPDENAACTALHGTLETIFGITEEVTMEDLEAYGFKLQDVMYNATDNGGLEYDPAQDFYYMEFQGHFVMFNNEAGKPVGPQTAVFIN